MIIREAQAADASAVLTLLEKLYTETQNLLFEPGETTATTKQYAHRIAQSANTDAGVMFLVERQAQLVAVCFGNRGIAKRNRHVLSLVIGVLRAHTRQGIGRALLAATEHWATAKGLHRLELTVAVTNHPAISLYETAGFMHEGLKKHSLHINDQYLDEYLMSKIISD